MVSLLVVPRDLVMFFFAVSFGILTLYQDSKIGFSFVRKIPSIFQKMLPGKISLNDAPTDYHLSFNGSTPTSLFQ